MDATPFQSVTLLAATAAGIGALHTLAGPDHYLPFIVLARAGRWSLRRTAVITALCGAGHLASSVVLGLLGVGLGLALNQLEPVEALRGDVAAWLLIGFGALYGAWGLRRGLKHRAAHGHLHARLPLHDSHGHDHDHAAGAHEPATPGHQHPPARGLTPWVLFIIFVLGPCEPLVPLVLYPASQGDVGGVLLVIGLFGGATLAVMLAVVLPAAAGLRLLRLPALERYAHALAGGAIAMSGAAIVFLGL